MQQTSGQCNAFTNLFDSQAVLLYNSQVALRIYTSNKAMAVPKKHKTKSGRNQRRAHDHLNPKSLAVCSHCGAAVRPHEVCKACGYYRGRQVKTAK